MSLAGRGAICIWNDIAPEGRDTFYDWHLHEHMPERLAVPGFLRGRRYIALDEATRPEFFTLYETQAYDVVTSAPYLERLNAPTDWTRRATSHFRNTMRALTHVSVSLGRGPGGVLASLRFNADEAAFARLSDGAMQAALKPFETAPQISGVHLCLTDAAASAGRTEESRTRTDIMTPPDGALLIEACNSAPALELARRACALLTEAGASDVVTGLYRMEYTRLDRDQSPG